MGKQAASFDWQGFFGKPKSLPKFCPVQDGLGKEHQLSIYDAVSYP
jgi:hypothetical protein